MQNIITEKIRFYAPFERCQALIFCFTYSIDGIMNACSLYIEPSSYMYHTDLDAWDVRVMSLFVCLI